MKKKTGFFVQDLHPFDKQVLVIVGNCNRQKLNNFLKKNVRLKSIIKDVNDKLDDFFKTELYGGVVYYEDRRMIILHEFVDNWDFYNSLLHEIHHLTHYICKERKMIDEMEAQAYFFTYVFDDIRRKLYKL